MVGRRVTGQPCVRRAVWGAGLGGAAQAGRRIGEAGGISAGITTIGPNPLPALTVDLLLDLRRVRIERAPASGRHKGSAEVSGGTNETDLGGCDSEGRC